MSNRQPARFGTSAECPSHRPRPADPKQDVAEDDSDESDIDEGEEGIIAPIAQDTIGQIVAGQAVSDLAGAVKELVDNALDAAATSINIRLFNQGLDTVEVSDDGSGVPRASRPLLAMKHATSKIRKFDDLYEDRAAGPQLGFRGEALFCLANMSKNLIVTTRTEKEELGQKIEFRRDGYMREGGAVDIPRKVGTTVAVVKLFDALPVRRTDMIRRIKAQRAKLMKVMQGYGVLCLGVRFNLIDITGPAGAPKCKSEVKMKTSEKSISFEETVSSVLGSKFLSGLCRMRVDLSDAVKAANEKRGSSDDSKSMSLPGCVWRMEGLVAKAPASTTGIKVLARDLQFFSINGRPVELPKISRVLGDVWRSYDAAAASGIGGRGVSKKRPACVLSFFLPSYMYDVNVSPDKREVLLIEESSICDLIWNALSTLWSSQSDGKFEANEVETLSNLKKIDSAREETERVPSEKTAEPASSSSITPENPTPRSEHTRMKRRNAFVHHFGNISHAAPDRVRAVDAFAKSDGIPLVADEEAEQPKTPSGGSNTCGPYVSTADSDDSRVRAETPADVRPSEVLLRDHHKWEQMRLQFNKIDSGQQEEIKKLAAMSENDEESEEDNGSGSASGDDDSVDRQPRAGNNDNTASKRRARKEPETGLTGDQSSKHSNRKRKRNVLGNLKAFALGARKESSDSGASDEESGAEDHQKMSEQTEAAAKGDESESLATRERGSHIRFPGQSAQEFKRHRVSMRRNSIVRTLVVSASLPTDCIDTEKANQCEDAAEASTEKEQVKAHSQREKIGRSTHEPPSPGPVCWSHFSGTQNIVQLARAARLKIDENRKVVYLRTKGETCDPIGASSGDSAGVVPELNEASGVVPEQNEASTKRSKYSKRKETRVVSLAKDDFFNMTIIGQFNLGFILARCQNNHLWILDQHACDEKYNFERLCSTTVVHEQKLLAPLPLELSPSEESCVLDNMEIFEQNGFRFSHDPSKAPRHRLFLTALPHSGAGGDGKKSVQFGREDVGALCAILGADGASSSSGFVAGFGTGADGSGQFGNNAVRRYAGGASTSTSGLSGSSIIRLPKAVAMFASRACRGSIMIGTALSQKEMEGVVRRLRRVEQPWDCPHGRPTMRHVKHLVEIIVADEREAAQHIAGPGLAVLSQADDDEGS